jgi:tRNA(Ile)-lysidine synthase TilS/MesJ
MNYFLVFKGIIRYTINGGFMEKYREIEKSIIKKFRKEIWSKFIKAIQEYELIKENDKIAVCISGGKDSMLLAKCMQELKHHGQMKFDLEFITMDPGYHEDNLKLIKSNAETLNIPIQIFETDVFNVVSKYGADDPCYLCARMRRGHLYAKAKELGCNKIALAHHFDDVIETIMLNILYNGHFQTMMPKLKSTNFEGMELIRPLYFVDEKDIKKWVNHNELTFMNCGCMISVCSTATKRVEVKNLIRNLESFSPYIRKNIFTTSTNINLDAVIGYKKGGKKYSFLDDYSNEE